MNTARQLRAENHTAGKLGKQLESVGYVRSMITSDTPQDVADWLTLRYNEAHAAWHDQHKVCMALSDQLYTEQVQSQIPNSARKPFLPAEED